MQLKLIHVSKGGYRTWETKSAWLVLKLYKHVLYITMAAKRHGCACYGDPSMPIARSLSDKSNRHPWFHWDTNVNRSGAMFCKKHFHAPKYPTHYQQMTRGEESNTSNKNNSKWIPYLNVKDPVSPCGLMRCQGVSPNKWRERNTFNSCRGK